MYSHLTREQRYAIYLGLQRKDSRSAIARQIGVSRKMSLPIMMMAVCALCFTACEKDDDDSSTSKKETPNYNGGSSDNNDDDDDKTLVICRECNGSGECKRCHGTGRSPSTQGQSCSRCKGTGVCQVCDGKGNLGYL